MGPEKLEGKPEGGLVAGPTPAVDKNEPQPSEVVRLCLTTGRVLDKHDDVPGAIAQYERVLKYDPNNYQAVRRLAVLYDRNIPPDFSKAEAFYQRLAKHSPHDADVFNDWGYSYYLRTQLPEAEKHLRHALQIDPKHQRAHSNLGLVLGQQKRYQDAFEAFRDAGVSEAEAHSNLAFIYLSQNNREDARRECRIAQQLSPSCKPARAMLVKLDSAEVDTPHVPPSRKERQSPPRRDREAEWQAVAAQLRESDANNAPLTRASQPGSPASEDSEVSQPAYTSPNGTKWFAVPPKTKWADSANTEPTALAPAEDNGQPGTATFDENP
jgi:Flp pilus assembly protein TadD